MTNARHHITREFRANRARFEHSFPAAYDFLMRLEAEGLQHELWLSSAINAHLYRAGGFLAYLRLKNPDLRPPSLLLSPNFNNRIVEYTTDQSDLLFPVRIDQLLTAEHGFDQGWARRLRNGATELQRKTPASFFNRLFDTVATLEDAEDLIPPARIRAPRSCPQPASQSPPPITPVLPQVTPIREHEGLGPQCSGDSKFAARMRRHQSWYRMNVLHVPCGTGPSENSKSLSGNMLRRKDGAAGHNFLTPEIHQVALLRLEGGGGSVEPFRLLHNMLSSQPMAFNLFGPLVNDLSLATDLARALWGEQIERVTRVEIEWAPSPSNEYIGDRTAFDAFIEYELVSGGLGFVGIETKLTEPFSQTHYDIHNYRRWMDADSPWRADAAGEVDHIRHNQLWRDHLLAWSMLQHADSQYKEGRLAVVSHPLDKKCAATIAGYRGLLRDEATFQDLPLDRLVATWAPQVGRSQWLADFTLRYLALRESEELPSNSAPVQSRPLTSRRISIVAQDGEVVRRGHIRALQQLENRSAYRQTLEMYYRHVGPPGVYLRLTNKGFTVISLDYNHCAGMVGVGATNSQQHTLRTLPPGEDEVYAAVAGYKEKINDLDRSSAEERFALGLIAGALDSNLSLPLAGVYFIHQEWRFPDQSKLDLLGVEPATGRLVVVELKKSEAKANEVDSSKHGDAWAQAVHYSNALYEHRDIYYEFFGRLARVMAKLHEAPLEMQQVNIDPEQAPATAVWWPGSEYAMFTGSAS